MFIIVNIDNTIANLKPRKESTRPPVNKVLNFKNSEGTQIEFCDLLIHFLKHLKSQRFYC
jgi:hypothetical protein